VEFKEESSMENNLPLIERVKESIEIKKLKKL
jgi:hypothetical protein